MSDTPDVKESAEGSKEEVLEDEGNNTNTRNQTPQLENWEGKLVKKEIVCKLPPLLERGGVID